MTFDFCFYGWESGLVIRVFASFHASLVAYLRVSCLVWPREIQFDVFERSRVIWGSHSCGQAARFATVRVSCVATAPPMLGVCCSVLIGAFTVPGCAGRECARKISRVLQLLFRDPMWRLRRHLGRCRCTTPVKRCAACSTFFHDGDQCFHHVWGVFKRP